MAKDKLFIDDGDRHVFRIAWFLAEEEDVGATLGDGGKTYSKSDLAKAKGGDRAHLLACMVVAKSDGVQRDSHGYFWESRREAQTALRAANLAMKNDGGPPWPEWAMKAAAEGWKAPKEWKPS